MWLSPHELKAEKWEVIKYADSENLYLFLKWPNIDLVSVVQSQIFV